MGISKKVFFFLNRTLIWLRADAFSEISSCIPYASAKFIGNWLLKPSYNAVVYVKRLLTNYTVWCISCNVKKLQQFYTFRWYTLHGVTIKKKSELTINRSNDNENASRLHWRFYGDIGEVHVRAKLPVRTVRTCVPKKVEGKKIIIK